VSKFKVGDKVRYLHDNYERDKNGPQKDYVYEVSAVREGGLYPGIHLKEFHPAQWWYGVRFELAEESKTKPHKWAKEIKAWADGAMIEVRSRYPSLREWKQWEVSETPAWLIHDEFEYRIKPEKKADVVRTHRVYINEDGGASTSSNGIANTKFTFDGETGKLKAVQLLS